QQYWKKLIGDFDNPTLLSKSYIQSTEDGQHSIRRAIPSDVHWKMEILAKRYGVTLNIILQATFACLLHRYSGETDVLFGATHAVRPFELLGIEETVGMFINTLPVRVVFKLEQQVSELIDILMSQQISSTEYGHL